MIYGLYNQFDLDFYQKEARDFLCQYDLVFKDIVFNIISVNIHPPSRIFYEKEMVLGDNNWFISSRRPHEDKHTSFFDVHKIIGNYTFRIRINTIKPTTDPERNIALQRDSCGLIHDILTRYYNLNDEILSYNKKEISKETTPDLYLKKREQKDIEKIYTIPRFFGPSKISKSRNLTGQYTYERSAPLLATKDLNWLSSQNYNESKYLISAYIRLKYAEEDYDKSLLVDVKKIDKLISNCNITCDEDLLREIKIFNQATGNEYYPKDILVKSLCYFWNNGIIK